MATSTLHASKKSAATSARKDNFAKYVTFVVIALVGLFLALYFYKHAQEKLKKSENYTPLPQVTIQTTDQVVRLQMTVQVDATNHDWMEKNKKTIAEIYRNTVNEIDPETFRSNAGRVAIQGKLKDEINKQMNVDKVVDVLYADVLIQTKNE